MASGRSCFCNVCAANSHSSTQAGFPLYKNRVVGQFSLLWFQHTWYEMYGSNFCPKYTWRASTGSWSHDKENRSCRAQYTERMYANRLRGWSEKRSASLDRGFISGSSWQQLFLQAARPYKTVFVFVGRIERPERISVGYSNWKSCTESPGQTVSLWICATV